ncbi:MAG: HyaD/HybD family hydrogenase maturation endopeptidase [Dehalococcoidales bacterium]|jgi:hydrogenase maturation protease
MPIIPGNNPEQENLPRVVVIGVGNLLMQDEGIGIHAVQALQETDLPPDVQLVDGGTSPDLITYTRSGDKMIIVDAARAGGQPGDVYRFKPEDISAGKGTLTSAHEMGVAENLKLMEMTGNQPKEVVIIGIEPGVIGWGMELSPRLQEALPRLVEIILREINTG